MYFSRALVSLMAARGRTASMSFLRLGGMWSPDPGITVRRLTLFELVIRTYEVNVNVVALKRFSVMVPVTVGGVEYRRMVRMLVGDCSELTIRAIEIRQFGILGELHKAIVLRRQPYDGTACGIRSVGQNPLEKLVSRTGLAFGAQVGHILSQNAPIVIKD
jgi:hypothetical protein